MWEGGGLQYDLRDGSEGSERNVLTGSALPRDQHVSDSPEGVARVRVSVRTHLLVVVKVRQVEDALVVPVTFLSHFIRQPSDQTGPVVLLVVLRFVPGQFQHSVFCSEDSDFVMHRAVQNVRVKSFVNCDGVFNCNRNKD